MQKIKNEFKITKFKNLVLEFMRKTLRNYVYGF